MSIAIEHLDFAYGRLAVLHDVSAKADRGRITAVLGPNAAGKSTLLRCIIGALRPKRGDISIGGQSIQTLGVQQRAHRIAYVPQRSIVSAAFTVRQVVELGRYALPPNPARVDEAMSSLDLIDVANRPYPDLSVGQQQRVTLARALAQLEPNGHLILDEPTSAMDLHHIAQCMQLLRHLAIEGATVLLAMHDLSLAASIADDAWLMDSGRLTAAGPACDVLEIERLHAIFRVKFEWVHGTDLRPRLLAQVPADPGRATIERT